jgi:hypothetical protein
LPEKRRLVGAPCERASLFAEARALKDMLTELRYSRDDWRGRRPGGWPAPADRAPRRRPAKKGVAAITRDNPPSAYALMFRTGAVEFVSLIGSEDPRRPGPRPPVSPYKIEEVVFVAWERFLDFAKSFGVDPPIWLSATLIDVGGLMLSTGAYGSHTPAAIRRNIVPLPEVFIGPDDLGKRPEVPSGISRPPVPAPSDETGLWDCGDIPERAALKLEAHAPPAASTAVEK